MKNILELTFFILSISYALFDSYLYIQKQSVEKGKLAAKIDIIGLWSI